MEKEKTKVKWGDSKDELWTYFGKCDCGNSNVVVGSKYCNECGKLIINNFIKMNYDQTKYFQIIDTGNLKTSELLKQCRKKFEVYSYYDDKELDKQFPSPKKSTTRYFKKNQEADEEYANKSANDLEKMGVEGITLRERILAELQYFNDTGNHLDVQNITLCSGSRFAGGDVPNVNWSGGFCIGRGYHPGRARPDLRTRVSCNILENDIELKDEKNKDKQGFCITCERCGFQKSI